jgi:hypothetical protein
MVRFDSGVFHIGLLDAAKEIRQKPEKQMIGPAYERTVAVCGRLQTITVYQKSKNVWVATGKYMGEDHQYRCETLATVGYLQRQRLGLKTPHSSFHNESTLQRMPPVSV